MASDRIRMLALAGLGLCLAGCASTGQPGFAIKDNFGEAYRQTLAAQVIDPAPEYGTAQAAVSADAMAQAIERYRTGKVRQPDRQLIGNLGKQGGGGGIGSAGNGGN